MRNVVYLFILGFVVFGIASIRKIPKNSISAVASEETIKKSVISAAPQNLSANLVKSQNAENDKITKALSAIEKKRRSPTAQRQPTPVILAANSIVPESKWKLWTSARAVQSDQTVAADQIVGKLGRYSIIETGNDLVDLQNFDRSTLAVVYDSRLRRPGLVTGMIKVHTSQKEQLQRFLADQQAIISDSFDDIQTFFVTSNQARFDLESLYFSLKAQSFINKIELDISDRDYAKK